MREQFCGARGVLMWNNFTLLSEEINTWLSPAQSVPIAFFTLVFGP
jgi:hypothetical protein